ncbi:MAG: gamma-glutamyl-gamma-aminobutyrate hydrolase family protein [Anaerolineae bacterium]|nr:gamma-glutamyl-gamma-aminobutyrate hydrolase family protein [Anaerolineae bacterium]
MAPLIGITSSYFKSPTNGWEYNRGYVGCIRAIADAGGLPVMIPLSVSDDVVRGVYERLDAVLLPGGGDVRPSVYGAEAHPATDNIDDNRDHVEIEVARWALEDNLPTLGICRGHQVMNVAYGGTLIQDIPTQIGITLSHDLSEPRYAVAHEVQLDPGSRLASILGANSVQVNSMHHQSVEQAAPNVCVTAYAPDGVVEALEVPDKHFILSVQWHPEDMYPHDPIMARIFKAFVDAAGGRA